MSRKVVNLKGIDYTTSTTVTQAKALKDNGYGFVCRYLVPERMAWKRLTKSEVDIISAVGLQIVSIYEAGASNAANGAAQGIIDGKEALIETKIVEQPEGSTIYFAIDYDTNNYDTVEAYIKAAGTQITGYNVGVYGSFEICEEMYKRGIKFSWQTYAWSHGQKSTHANVYQYQNGVDVCGINCDANESFGNEGFWNLSTAFVADPPPQEVNNMFADFKDVAEYAKLAVQKGEDKGIFKGDENNNFKPNDPITREDIAVVLDRLGLLG